MGKSRNFSRKNDYLKIKIWFTDKPGTASHYRSYISQIDIIVPFCYFYPLLIYSFMFDNACKKMIRVDPVQENRHVEVNILITNQTHLPNLNLITKIMTI